MSVLLEHPRCSAYCNRYFHFHTINGTITKDLIGENQKTQSCVSILILLPWQSNSVKSRPLYDRIAVTFFCTTMICVSILVTTVFYALIGVVCVLERAYLLVFPDQLKLLERKIQLAEQILAEQSSELQRTANLEVPLKELADQIRSFQKELDKIERQAQQSARSASDQTRQVEERAQEADKVFTRIATYLRENFFVGDMKDGMRLSDAKKKNFRTMADRAREIQKVKEDLPKVEEEIDKLNIEITKFDEQLGQLQQQLEQLTREGALTHDGYVQALADLTRQVDLIKEDKHVQLHNPRQVVV